MLVVTLVTNEDINDEELIRIRLDKTADRTFNREYSSNVDETFNIYDLVGNPGNVTVKLLISIKSTWI